MKFKILAAIVIFSIGLFAFESGSFARYNKPDKYKPIPATDIAIAKKLTTKGRPAQGGGKPSRGLTATGILGGEPFNGNRYAIVIGMNNYPATNNDLNIV